MSQKGMGRVLCLEKFKVEEILRKRKGKREKERKGISGGRDLQQPSNPKGHTQSWESQPKENPSHGSHSPPHSCGTKPGKPLSCRVRNVPLSLPGTGFQSFRREQGAESTALTQLPRQRRGQLCPQAVSPNVAAAPWTQREAQLPQGEDQRKE